MMKNPETTIKLASSERAYRIPPTTRLGEVHLTVRNLAQQIEFYTRVLGFQVRNQEGKTALLGTTSQSLLRLYEDPSAKRNPYSAGMYHFAILYPSLKGLARAIAHLFSIRYPNSPTDHGISKTTYLDDPEGNTIELYVRSLEDASIKIVDGQYYAFYADGRIGSGRDPLDLDKLFSELDASDPLGTPLPEGTQMGHVHLYANDFKNSIDFYTNVLGFEPGLIIPSFRMGDVGLDEQQPHVIAFNIWRGENAPPANSADLGMRYFTIVLPSQSALDRLIEHIQATDWPLEKTETGYFMYDPSNIKLALTSETGS